MNKKQQNKTVKKKIKKADRLKRLLGIDLCACGPMNTMKCEGICREIHKDETNIVKCPEKYQINKDILNPKIKRFRKNKKDLDSKNVYRNNNNRKNRHEREDS